MVATCLYTGRAIKCETAERMTSRPVKQLPKPIITREWTRHKYSNSIVSSLFTCTFFMDKLSTLHVIKPNTTLEWTRHTNSKIIVSIFPLVRWLWTSCPRFLIKKNYRGYVFDLYRKRPKMSQLQQ